MTKTNKPLERAKLKLNALNYFAKYVFKGNFIITGYVLAIFLLRDCVMHELSFFTVYKRVMYAVISACIILTILIFYYVIENDKIEEEIIKELNEELEIKRKKEI